MSKVLYIKASPKKVNESVTFRMSEAFIEEYKKCNPDDEVVTVDLYEEGVTFLTSEDVESIETGTDSVVKRYAEEFKNADKYIFAAPFWNLSIPAILKAYFDYIFRANVTFMYTEQGPVGLLENKKAVYIVARGGFYSSELSGFDFATSYLRGALGFLGVKDLEVVACENTSVLAENDLDEEIKKSIDKAKEMAKYF